LWDAHKTTQQPHRRLLEERKQACRAGSEFRVWYYASALRLRKKTSAATALTATRPRPTLNGVKKEEEEEEAEEEAEAVSTLGASCSFDCERAVSGTEAVACESAARALLPPNRGDVSEVVGGCSGATFNTTLAPAAF
jgi:hypothetical protein